MDKALFEILRSRVSSLLAQVELSEGQGADLIRLVNQRTRFKAGLNLRCPFCHSPEGHHAPDCALKGREIVTPLGEPTERNDVVVKRRGRKPGSKNRRK